MKQDLNRIYHLVIKFIEIIEEELESLSDNQPSNSLQLKKSIADNLAKLVTLIEKINKLQKYSNENEEITFQEDYQSIIDGFLQKYLKDQQ